MRILGSSICGGNNHELLLFYSIFFLFFTRDINFYHFVPTLLTTFPWQLSVANGKISVLSRCRFSLHIDARYYRCNMNFFAFSFLHTELPRDRYIASTFCVWSLQHPWKKFTARFFRVRAIMAIKRAYPIIFKNL